MQSLENITAKSFGDLVRSSATPEEVEHWLGEPTDEVCGYCGWQALQRFEALNGRCESCRLRYLEAAGADMQTESCATCRGTGWRSREIPGQLTTYTVVRRCESCKPGKDELILQKLSVAGVLPDYYRCTYTTWEGGVPDQARTFAADPESAGVLYIHGLQGRGKTHLATAVLRELIGRGLRCLWRDCHILVDQCREWTRRRADDTMDEELHRLRDADVLLLDDLGAGRQTDYSVDVVDGIIRWRHARRGPMIVTSNRDLRGLVTPEGEGGLGRNPAIASRLRGLEVHLDGPDRRAREAAK